VENRGFWQFAVRREEPLQQQLSAVSVLLVAMQEHVKAKKVGHCQEYFV
jgi:hypothetical protein